MPVQLLESPVRGRWSSETVATTLGAESLSDAAASRSRIMQGGTVLSRTQHVLHLDLLPAALAKGRVDVTGISSTVRALRHGSRRLCKAGAEIVAQA